MPAAVLTAKAGGELEGPQKGIEGDADDVQHHGQRRGKEAGIGRCDLRAAAQFSEAKGTRDDGDNAEDDQSRGHEPLDVSGLVALNGWGRLGGLLGRNHLFVSCLNEHDKGS